MVRVVVLAAAEAEVTHARCGRSEVGCHPSCGRLVTVGLLSALLASVVVASAAAVVKKPKPWQWTPTKVALKLIDREADKRGRDRVGHPVEFAAYLRGEALQAGTRASYAPGNMAVQLGDSA